MKRVHKVCQWIKSEAPRAKDAKDCEQCPMREMHEGHGYGTRACVLIAKELISVVKFGQPFGKRFARSRASWPDRSGYTDKWSRARNKGNLGISSEPKP